MWCACSINLERASKPYLLELFQLLLLLLLLLPLHCRCCRVWAGCYFEMRQKAIKSMFQVFIRLVCRSSLSMLRGIMCLFNCWLLLTRNKRKKKKQTRRPTRSKCQQRQYQNELKSEMQEGGHHICRIVVAIAISFAQFPPYQVCTQCQTIGKKRCDMRCQHINTTHTWTLPNSKKSRTHENNENAIKCARKVQKRVRTINDQVHAHIRARKYALTYTRLCERMKSENTEWNEI